MNIGNTQLQQPGVVAINATNGSAKGTDDNGQPATAGRIDDSADKLSLSVNQLVVSRQVISHQIDSALNISTTDPVADPALYTAKSFNEALAGRVVQKINEEAYSGAPYQDAVKSVSLRVDEGFQAASTEIQQLGITSQAVSDQFVQSQQYVGQAIDSVASLNGDTPAAGTDVVATSSSVSVNEVSASSELTASLQVNTQDGDVVTINLSRTKAVVAGDINTDGASVSYGDLSSTSQIEITIQGDLSEDEYESIKNISEEVREIAQKLTSGKTGEAIEKIGELEIDPSVIANLSMEMTRSYSFEAVRAYSSVSQMRTSIRPASLESVTQPTPAATGSEAAPAAANGDIVTSPVVNSNTTETTEVKTADVMIETAVKVQELVAQSPFDNPYSALSNLFQELADMMQDSLIVKNNHKDFVSELFEHLLESHEHDDADDDHEHGEYSLS